MNNDVIAIRNLHYDGCVRNADMLWNGIKLCIEGQEAQLSVETSLKTRRT